MIDYIKNANLPEHDVDTVIVSGTDKSLLNKLTEQGINYILSYKNTSIIDNLAEHTDLSVYHKGDNQFIMDASQYYLAEKLTDADIVIPSEPIKSPYPGDCRLNAADIGDYIICNKKITDKKIIDFAHDNHKTIIDVGQGYSNCSVCVAGRNIILTEDQSILKCVIRIPDIKVLMLPKGSIKLHGYDYGFIGGACTLIGKSHLLINGDLSKHSAYEQIIDFLNANDIIYTDIKGKDIVDIGGIIPIKERY